MWEGLCVKILSSVLLGLCSPEVCPDPEVGVGGGRGPLCGICSVNPAGLWPKVQWAQTHLFSRPDPEF